MDRAIRPAGGVARRLRPSLLLALMLGTVLSAPLAGQDEFCYHPANLSINCDMESFSDRAPGGDVRVVADGWGFWVEAGNPAIDVGYDSPRPPSQRIWSDGAPFTAGLFQRVEGLTPGATYRAGVVWAPYTSPDGSMMRQIGLDPTGGSDPFGPTVQWGAEQWGFSRMTLLETRAVASTTAMSLFVRVHHPQSYGADQIFIDGIWMHRDESVPIVVSPTPEPPTPEPPTPEPPTPEPPTPEPPTPEPPTPEPPTPTEAAPTVTPVPTATAPPPSTTPSATPSASPSPRPSPSGVPSATASSPPLATATTSAVPPATVTGGPTVLAAGTGPPRGGVSIASAGSWGMGGAVAAAVALGLWFAGRRRIGRR